MFVPRTAAIAWLIALSLGGQPAAAYARLEAQSAGGVTVPTRVVMVPEAIDRTGKDDVTEAMNRFFASAQDGSTVRLQPGARYRMEDPLVLEGHHDMTVDGNGATTFATTAGGRRRSHWVISHGARVRITGLTVRGANPQAGTTTAAYVVAKEAQQGFELAGTSDIELDHNTVTDVYGDFVYVGRDVAGNWTSNVWVHDNHFTRNGRQGVSVTSGRNVVVERNDISETRQSTIDLEPNSAAGGAENVFVLNNVIGPGRLRFVSAHGRGPVNDIVVSGNVLRGRPLSIDVLPPGSTRRHSFYIVDNHSDAPYTRTAVLLTRVDGALVRGNTQAITRDRVGVVAASTCSVAVLGNAFGPGVRGIDQSGPRCGGPAPQSLPTEPDLLGRSRAAASSASPGAGVAAGPSARTSARHEGRLPWVVVAAVVLALLGVVCGAVLVRRAPPADEASDPAGPPVGPAAGP